MSVVWLGAPACHGRRITNRGPADQVNTLAFQGEECLDQDTVEKYVEALRQGEEILPVRVCYDGECYWLADGFHRLRAARTLRRRKIKAEIVQGTYADMEACWRAVIQAINDDLLK